MNEPLVLLPGMMCDERLFTPQIDEFSAKRQVIVMALTGRTTITGLARDILKKAPNKFGLLGLSMGGIVAMEIMRQAPDRVTRLALVDTNPMADAPERKLIRDQQIERAKRGELRAIMRDEMKPNYLADGDNKTAILGLCMEMAEGLGSQVFVDQSKALQTRDDQTKTLKTINVPTLITCGEHDTLCPIEKHQLMHELISGSSLKVIANAGHLPTLEQSETLNLELRQWLEA